MHRFLAFVVIVAFFCIMLWSVGVPGHWFVHMAWTLVLNVVCWLGLFGAISFMTWLTTDRADWDDDRLP